MANIVYTFENHVYLNITNSCPCRCEFCIRKNGDSVGDADTLWFSGHSPSFDEIKAEIDVFDFSKYADEIIFCGYGEPTCAYDNLIKTAKYLKEKLPHCRLRINTNGLSDLLNEKPTAKEICDIMDIVSISLNAPTSEKYEALCHPTFKEKAFPAILKFAEECKQYDVHVKFSLVDVISEEDIADCQKIADSMGIPLRVREYTAD